MQWPFNGSSINIAKGTTKPRVEIISQVQTQILVKFHLQNLGQESTSKSQPNLASESRPRFNFITSTKHQQKKLANFQLQILPELQLQNLDQPLCSKSEQKFSFLTKPQLRNLQQIVANTILISNSYKINKFWVGIFTRQGQSSLLSRSESVS